MDEYPVRKIAYAVVKRNALNKKLYVEYLGEQNAPGEQYYTLPECGYRSYPAEGMGIVYDPEKISWDEAVRIVVSSYLERQARRVSSIMEDISEFVADPLNY